MKQQRAFYLLAVVVGVLMLGIAYAAITSVTLNVRGNVIASPNQGNFKVKFTGVPTFTKTGNGSAVLDIIDDTHATMNVSGLTVKGDKLTATFSVINESEDIVANLSANATCSNNTYFRVTTSIDNSKLQPGQTTKLHVTVLLNKTPISGDVSATLNIGLTATPSYAS